MNAIRKNSCKALYPGSIPGVASEPVAGLHKPVRVWASCDYRRHAGA
jgi:hypothetical protein